MKNFYLSHFVNNDNDEDTFEDIRLLIVARGCSSDVSRFSLSVLFSIEDYVEATSTAAEACGSTFEIGGSRYGKHKMILCKVCAKSIRSDVAERSL